MMDTRELAQLAMESGAYRDIELDILIDTLDSWKAGPGRPYFLVEVQDDRRPAGFCLFKRASDTEFTFDIHTFLVGRQYRCKGPADRLLELVIEEVLLSARSAMIRVEISTIKESAVEPGFFPAHGFGILGHIPDFYSPGNDYWIYARRTSRS
ncbi:MAG TPA: GNAT family N-acetyltransferase [Magnetospirillaceae bacterium]|nr:GNAT family N-acetyltransferase [Magnetospirillaceae bacterium]